MTARGRQAARPATRPRTGSRGSPTACCPRRVSGPPRRSRGAPGDDELPGLQAGDDDDRGRDVWEDVAEQQASATECRRSAVRPRSGAAASRARPRRARSRAASPTGPEHRRHRRCAGQVISFARTSKTSAGRQPRARGTWRRRTRLSFLPSTPSKRKRNERAVCAGIVRERLPKDAGHYRKAGPEIREFLRLLWVGVGCSRGPGWAHNPKVAGSNPAPATKQNQGATVNAVAPLGF